MGYRINILLSIISINIRYSFDEGTALAVETLCNIFHHKKTTKFEHIYLASFYSCLADVLLVLETFIDAFVLIVLLIIYSKMEGS
jgi:hypothetical protein